MYVGIAPRTDGTPDACEGYCDRKPWQYPCQVVIPHLNAFNVLPLIIELWQHQTITPYILIVDTGSDEAGRLRSVEAENVEVVSIRGRGYRTPAQIVAMAQDIALALCQSEYQLCTHADVFPRSRTIIEQYMAICTSEQPVVGWRMSDRSSSPHADERDFWRESVGHVMTMLLVDAIRDRFRIRWHAGQFDTTAATPDTEFIFNQQLRADAIRPVFLGSEATPDVRQVTPLFDHCRSHFSREAYDRDAAGVSSLWIESAISEARARLAGWRQESIREAESRAAGADSFPQPAISLAE